MARISTRQASEKIRNLEAFTTNGSLRGDWQGGAYVVTSYSTAIAHINPTEGVALLNGQKYSKTTTTHQTQARIGVHYLGEAMPLEVVELEDQLAFIQRSFRA